MIFSIVTAVYNNKDLIVDAIESVRSQVGVRTEHIIQDGGSKDGTVEVIQGLNKGDLKLESRKDKGIYDALNLGMKKATGDIIVVLQSDDLFHSKTVLKEVEKLFLDGADIVYGDLNYVQREDISKIHRKWNSGTYDDFQLSLGWVAPYPAFFISRRVYEEIGEFDLSYRISADYDYVLRCLKPKKFKVSYLPVTLSDMRVGGESNRSFIHKFKGSKEDYRIAKKNFLFPLGTVLFKVIRKVPQLFLKS